MVHASTVADPQCVHAMVAEDVLRFMVGLMVYVWFAMDAFFNMTTENKFPAVLAWLVLIPVRTLKIKFVSALTHFRSLCFSLQTSSLYT